MTSPRMISFLSDFGLHDPFVGIIHAVIAQHAPEVRVIDLSHQITPFDTVLGGFWLGKSFSRFPVGSVHLAVVDPGVGTSRKALVIRAAGHLFVGPDNGLLALALAGKELEIREINPQGAFVNREGELSLSSGAAGETAPLSSVSGTFHGRDVFAPVAARLASGALAFEDVGPPLEKIVASPLPSAQMKGHKLVGAIVGHDHFGNLLTNIELPLARTATDKVWFRDHCLSFVRTYAKAPSHSLGAVINSFGVVEIFQRNGSAHLMLQPDHHEPLSVHP